MIKYSVSVYLLAVLICGCAPQSKTLYKYTYIPAAEQTDTINKKVYFAPFNLHVRDNDISKESREIVYRYIVDYLKRNDFVVLPQNDFVEIWANNYEKIGGFYNSRTGAVMKESVLKCVEMTIGELKKRNDFSYVVFTDIYAIPVELRNNSDYGEWHGVMRELPRKSVFKNAWRTAKAASLMITIIDENNNLHFRSVGGLDFVQISTREGNNYRLEMNPKPFDNRENIAEGVNIALHPFIVYDKYPIQQ